MMPPLVFPRRFLLTAAVLVALLLAGCHGRNTAVEIATPDLAMKALAATSLYYNGPARPWLLAMRPELLTPEDRAENSERARQFAQAVQAPKLFRQLDRRDRFDTLLLGGDPSLYRPLLEHLLEAKDWRLAYLDHTSLILRREVPADWQVSALNPLAATFRESRTRAAFFAQAALRLLALRRAPEAKLCLDQAQALDAQLPEVWNGHAIYRMNRGEWTPALTSANRALALDANFLPALATKTQVLYSTKKFSEAYDLSRKLVDAYPDEPGLLFYHAKICHEAHDYADEVRTLQRLVKIAESAGWPASGYRLYLAQAYARAGQARPAIEEFDHILADADLSQEQRTFAEQTLAQVKERAGLR